MRLVKRRNLGVLFFATPTRAKKTPGDLNQDPTKNKPINAEVNFRTEYHQKNPGQKNAATWKAAYDKRGYKGLKQ